MEAGAFYETSLLFGLVARNPVAVRLRFWDTEAMVSTSSCYRRTPATVRLRLKHFRNLTHTWGPGSRSAREQGILL